MSKVLAIIVGIETVLSVYSIEQTGRTLQRFKDYEAKAREWLILIAHMKCFGVTEQLMA
jgi:hypothetical protein